MRIRRFSQGKRYSIECPEGSRVERGSDRAVPGGAPLTDRLIVAWGGQEIPIPADSEELLPLLAEAGRCDLALRGEPEPGPALAGVACPGMWRGGCAVECGYFVHPPGRDVTARTFPVGAKRDGSGSAAQVRR
jgi:hypothetical protein